MQSLKDENPMFFENPIVLRSVHFLSNTSQNEKLSLIALTIARLYNIFKYVLMMFNKE